MEEVRSGAFEPYSLASGGAFDPNLYLSPLRTSESTRHGKAAAYVSLKNVTPPIARRIARLTYIFDSVYVLASKHCELEIAHLPVTLLGWKKTKAGKAFKNFQTTKFAVKHRLAPTWDLPAKRNVALLHAKQQGYTAALLIDDDVWPASIQDLAIFRGIENAIAGKAIERAADISFVEWAICGNRPTPFVSGNYLYFDPRSTQSFFPSVYNEDWLFTLSSASLAPTMLPVLPALMQCVGDPATPARVRMQEFGEVLAIGLTSYGPAHRLSSGDWRDVYAHRKSNLRGYLGTASEKLPKRILSEAARALASFSSSDLHRFVCYFADDIADWQHVLQRG